MCARINREMVPIDSRDLEALSADWLMLNFLFVNRNTEFPCKPRVCIGTPGMYRIRVSDLISSYRHTSKKFISYKFTKITLVYECSDTYKFPGFGALKSSELDVRRESRGVEPITSILPLNLRPSRC